MRSEKKEPVSKRLHARNRNRDRYDLDALLISNPELKGYMKPNHFGENSIDFSSPAAVKLLNKSLLNHYYGIANWDFPDENLCPPIPGRADYLHYIADLLAENNFGVIPKGETIICLDVGVGASCIYPIIGVTEFGWKFIGSDIDPKSIASAQDIVDANESLKNKITFRLQKDPRAVFRGIIGDSEKIDLSICNPPFHVSPEAAEEGTRRKIKNLSGKTAKTPELNFAGNGNELVCDGGEFQFIQNMISDSKIVAKNCFWFSTLVSKASNLKGIYRSLEKNGAIQIKTLPMGTGNKSSRIVAWTFLSKSEQKEWRETRWKKQR
ncbi:MAG: rRNA m(6)A618 methyltransferase [Fluviicola sp.]|jgi:23S rRNA (adenine1618-N6)-methyltransferase|uniref:23S rRNA (adenine(1618)-N(6))-methyltransferase RlmF n=1 Tax=Fluviicola sp. TaxID=1917219 RepID=UPI002632CB27|nr:23S rRNA (adenine(1618)-N(6))-methyltransferase RlmF [Fluviicola sp.]MDF3025858.1 rRNA m(6)A618 methyltransferase [Fluviicola sp.]